jgi:hypothetical protein
LITSDETVGDVGLWARRLRGLAWANLIAFHPIFSKQQKYVVGKAKAISKQ